MPPRSNAFQRLILQIERQLSPGLTVRESAVVPDTQGTPREIDILIEGKVGARTLAVAIECRDHARPQTIEWIDAIIGKYAHLPVDRRVAVSSSGFAESAISKAAAHRIDTLTLEDAENEDWTRDPSQPATIVVSSETLEILDAVIDVLPGSPGSFMRPFSSAAMSIRSPSATRVKLDQAISSFIHESEAKAKLIAAARRNAKGLVEATFRLGGWTLIDSIGRKAKLNTLRLSLQLVRSEGVVRLSHKHYGDARVSYGTANVGDVGVHAVVAGGPDGTASKKIDLALDFGTNAKRQGKAKPSNRNKRRSK